jgi:hypothetical protein
VDARIHHTTLQGENPLTRSIAIAVSLLLALMASGPAIERAHAQSRQNQCQWALAQNGVLTNALNLVASATTLKTKAYDRKSAAVVRQFNAVNKRWGRPSNEGQVYHELGLALKAGRTATRQKNKTAAIKSGYSHLESAVRDVQSLGC